MDASDFSSWLEYDPGTGIFRRKDGRPFTPSMVGGNKTTGEYFAIKFKRRTIYLHRLAFLLMTGKWPSKLVDHIDGIKLNNKWCNLRLASMAQNKANEGLRVSNTSGLKGVSWHKKAEKWRAYVGSHGRHLGLFDCPAAAHLAYVVASSTEYGAFARAS